MPKISVILPVYNEENYLHQCLNSLCLQTLTDIEIICIDDGSTDKSLEMLRNFEKKDDRVKVLTQKNQYAGVARNNGMKSATGKYLIFLDSDDFFELDMLEKLYMRAEKDKLDVTLCRYGNLDDRNGEKIELDFKQYDSFLPEGKSVFSGGDIKYAGIFQAMIGWAWDKLFRADFVKKSGYEFSNFRSSEDGYFVYMLAAKAKRMGIVREPLVWHRVYNNASLSNSREHDWESGFRMMDVIHKEMMRLNLYDKYKQSFINWVVDFQVWYLTTLYEEKAFLKSYEYIREHTEQEYGVMEYKGEFFCEQKSLEYYNLIMKISPEQFLLCLLKDKDETISRRQNNGAKKGWVFPYESVPKNSRLIIYGAGVVGHSYFEQLKVTGYCREFHMVDQNYQKYDTEDYPVEETETIKNMDFDYILVAIAKNQLKAQVMKILNEKYSIPSDKII